MGDYLKKSYEEAASRYKWRVLYNGKVIKEFEHLPETARFYHSMRASLRPEERSLLRFEIKFEDVGNGI